jgi:hypothetical protein
MFLIVGLRRRKRISSYPERTSRLHPHSSFSLQSVSLSVVFPVPQSTFSLYHRLQENISNAGAHCAAIRIVLVLSLGPGRRYAAVREQPDLLEVPSSAELKGSSTMHDQKKSFGLQC